MAKIEPGERLTSSPQETMAVGRELAARLRPGDILLLFGELGSGKTCLVRGLAEGLGVAAERIHSPSFIMVTSHAGSMTLHHADLYRLSPGEDFSDLGLHDLFASAAVTVVEWAERLPEAALPIPRLEVWMSIEGETSRRIVIHPVPAAADAGGSEGHS